MMRFRVFLLLIVLVCGCRVGPRYRPPPLDAPVEWKNEHTAFPAPFFEGFWWEIFQDEVLNCLELIAVVSNPNIYIAMDHVAQARAIAGVDKSALYPQFNLNPSYTNTGELFKIYLPGVAKNFFPANFPTIYRIHQLQYVMPLNMSYELDLWGKLRWQYDSAVFNAQAQEENLQTALLTLTTDLASSYFKLRSYDALIDVQENNLDLLRRNLALVRSRHQKGLVSELDVVTAQQELSDNMADLEETVRLRGVQEDALAALLGMPASEFCIGKMPLVDVPPGVQPNLPSCVLLQRPDLRSLERTMASEHALIGVAYASFFPSVELTGILGFMSPDLRQFLTWKSRLWQIGVNAAQPIFNGFYYEYQLDYSYAEYWEALHNYQQRVLTAFQEVEDALINIEQQAKEYDLYMMSSDYSNKRIKLTLSRYKNGLSNYLEVVDSERTKIQADTNRVNTLGLRYLSTVQLIKALGGSWSFSLKPAFEEPRSCCGQLLRS
jgi:outer membrane protein, multidrug efflux system